MEPSLPPPRGGCATRAVRGATTPPDVVPAPVSAPLWLSSTWATADSAEVGTLLTDDRDGSVYDRYDDPTATTRHATVASLHGAPAAWSLASRTVAIRATLDALGGQGRVLATRRTYGGTYPLVLHPASTSHRQLDDAAPAAADLGPGTVRSAVGIEEPDDLVADLRRGLDAAAAAGETTT